MKYADLRQFNKDSIADPETNKPQTVLGFIDAVALIVGIVVGAGIFSFPSLVAANSSSPAMFIFVWLLGGLISLIGSVCYAELATTFPSAGGDYTFLKCAFGDKLAFFFAWARLSIIQTGSAAILAFVFGDYASQFLDLGEFSSIFYAALIIVILTAINIAGIKLGTGIQKVLTSLEIIGVLAVIMAGFFFVPENSISSLVSSANSNSSASLGMALVFALLTFGGWNEAVYISAEMKNGSKQLAKALIAGILIITTLYLLINLAFLNALGLVGIAESEAVASDIMKLTFSDNAAWLLGLMVAISALTSANATIFTGARTNYALGKDFKTFKLMGKWNERSDAPINAFIVQGSISLFLVGLGFWTREGIKTIVDYTAPVFWFFFLLVGISLFVLRRKEPDAERPFRVPFYPFTPLVFCLTSAYLLYSSLIYTGFGAIAGILVLLIGAIFLVNEKRINQTVGDSSV